MSMKLKAYAKINLTLDICGKRADGYHLIDSVMQSVSFYDEVTVDKSDTIDIVCDNEAISGKSNIAFAAANAFFNHTRVKGGALITIKKNIPLAAGIGGGSADAAAVIRALDSLYNTNLPLNTLCSIALSVGADVPFCLLGGTVRVGGIGEKLEKLPCMPDCSILLIKTKKKSSTADMYLKLDSKPQLPEATPKMISALAGGDIQKIAHSIGNAFISVNDIFEQSDMLLKLGADAVSLSGSGPTLYAIFTDDDSAHEAQRVIKSQGFFACVAHPVKMGTETE